MAMLFENEVEPTIGAIAPWFGSNRMLAPIVGQEIGRVDWCGVLFAGSMSEVRCIKARSILVNDKHRDVINLARVIASPDGRDWLIKQASALPFHPDVLEDAQQACKSEELLCGTIDRGRALNYFVAVWMGRSAKAGTGDEFDGGLAVRYTASGGGSNVRYRSAIESVEAWGKIFEDCEFTAEDFRVFLDKCHDRKGHAIYSDAPFPEKGGGYRHTFTLSDHRELAAKLARFDQARVVIRFYDHPLIRELYPEGSHWTWRRLDGRDQANDAKKPEVLIINGTSNAT